MNTTFIVLAVVFVIAILVIDIVAKQRRINKLTKERNELTERSEKYSVDNTLVNRKYTDLLKKSDATAIKLKTLTNVLTAYVNDLESYRKIAKGYEVAGIKKSLKLFKDHTTTLSGESLI